MFVFLEASIHFLAPSSPLHSDWSILQAAEKLFRRLFCSYRSCTKMQVWLDREYGVLSWLNEWWGRASEWGTRPWKEYQNERIILPEGTREETTGSTGYIPNERKGNLSKQVVSGREIVRAVWAGNAYPCLVSGMHQCGCDGSLSDLETWRTKDFAIVFEALYCCLCCMQLESLFV